MARFGRRWVWVGVGALLLVVLVAVVGNVLTSGGRDAATSTIGVAEPAPARDAGAPSGAPDAATSSSSGSAESDAKLGLTEPGQVPPAVDGVQRSLVRSAQLTVEVEDASTVSRQVRTAVAAAGGLVTEEQSSDTGSYLVLRVPADRLDQLIDDVGTLGERVVSRSSQVVDATEQVVDLDARVVSQQASVARVRSLLAQATSIGDIVAIESELSRREADLDSLTSRLTALRDQVALSTLTVNLQGPSAVLFDDEPPAPGFLEGLEAGWEGVRGIGAVAAAVVGFVLPFLPVLAVLAGIVWLVLRIVRGRRTPAPVGGRGGPGSEGES